MMRRSNARARDAIAARRMRRRELLLLLSAAMTAPQLVLAQLGRGSRLGVVDPTGLRGSTVAAIREGLEDAGYSFGDVAIEYLGIGWTDSRFNELITLAIDEEISDVEVIVTPIFSGIQAAKDEIGRAHV